MIQSAGLIGGYTLIVLGGGLAISACLYFAVSVFWSNTVSEVSRWCYEIAQRNITLACILMFTIIVLSLILGIPVTPFEIVSGFVFRWLGMALCIPAKVCGSVVTYVIGRYFCRQVLKKYMSGFKQIRIVESMIHEKPLQYATMLRSAVIPLFVKNYGLAVIDTPFLPYLFATIVTTSPYGVLHGLIGIGANTVLDAIHGRQKAPAEIIFLLIAFVLTTLFMVVLAREYKRKAEELKPNDLPSV